MLKSRRIFYRLTALCVSVALLNDPLMAGNLLLPRKLSSPSASSLQETEALSERAVPYFRNSWSSRFTAHAIRDLWSNGRNLPGAREQTAGFEPANDFAASAIKTGIARDRWVEDLSLKNLKSRLSAIQGMDDYEHGLGQELMRRVTDGGSSLPVLLEQVENALMRDARGVDLLMLSLPLADTNKLSQKFGLEGFTDDLKERLQKRAVATGLRAAFVGGRMVVMGVTADWAKSQGAALIDSLRSELVASYAHRLGDADVGEFSSQVNNLRFYAAHTHLYLGEPGEHTVVESHTAREIWKELEVKRPALSQFPATPAGRDDYFKKYDEFLSWRRGAVAANVQHFLRSSRDSPQSGGRKKASLLAEFFLDDAYRKMNERLEVVEKTADDALHLRLAAVLEAESKGGPNSVIPILDDRRIHALIKNLSTEDGAQRNLLAALFEQLQAGRGKTIPIFKYATDRAVDSHLPRLAHIVPQWPGDDTRVLRLQRARDALLTNPSETHLAEFKAAYRAYRLSVWEALVLAYRDPRLEQVFKLASIDEAVRADETGDWRRLQVHLGAWTAQPMSAAKAERLIGLIVPGCFVVKRPVGDEVAFVIRDDRGNYHMALAELNKGNAYFTAYPPDARDHRYHSILLGFVEASRPYAGTHEPLEFLNGLQDVLIRKAPGSFVPTEKVPTPLGIERMESRMDPESEGLVPSHAISRTGAIYKRRVEDPARWDLVPPGYETEIVGAGLIAYKTTLSASIVKEARAVRADRVRATFDRLDKNVGYQKEWGWQDRIVTVQEIEGRLQVRDSPATPALVLAISTQSLKKVRWIILPLSLAVALMTIAKMTGYYPLSWRMVYAPGMGVLWLGLLSGLTLGLDRLSYWLANGRPIPERLHNLFGLKEPALTETSTEFIQYQGTVLSVSMTLARMIGPSTPFWIRIPAKAVLYALGIPAHEILHHWGAGELPAYAVGQILPAVAGFLIFDGGFGWGIIGAFALVAFTSLFFLALQWLSRILMQIYLGLYHLRYEAKRFGEDEVYRVSAVRAFADSALRTLRLKNYELYAHVWRVRLIAEHIAYFYGLPEKQKTEVYLSATFYDIGKLWTMTKFHSFAGWLMLWKRPFLVYFFPELRQAARMALIHHQLRWMATFQEDDSPPSFLRPKVNTRDIIEFSDTLELLAFPTGLEQRLSSDEILTRLLKEAIRRPKNLHLVHDFSRPHNFDDLLKFLDAYPPAPPEYSDTSGPEHRLLFGSETGRAA